MVAGRETQRDSHHQKKQKEREETAYVLISHLV